MTFINSFVSPLNFDLMLLLLFVRLYNQQNILQSIHQLFQISRQMSKEMNKNTSADLSQSNIQKPNDRTRHQKLLQCSPPKVNNFPTIKLVPSLNGMTHLRNAVTQVQRVIPTLPPRILTIPHIPTNVPVNISTPKLIYHNSFTPQKSPPRLINNVVPIISRQEQIYKQCTNLKNINAQLKQRCIETQSKNKQLQQKCLQIQNKMSNLEKENRAQIEKLKIEHQKQMTLVQKIRSQVDKYFVQKKCLLQQLKDCKKKIQNLKAQNTTLKHQSQQQVKNLRQQLSKKQSQITKIRQDYECKIQDTCNKVVILNEQLQRNAQQLKGKDIQIQVLNIKIQEKKGVQQYLVDSVGKLKYEMQQMIDGVTKSQKYRQIVMEKNKVLEEQINKLNQFINSQLQNSKKLFIKGSKIKNQMSMSHAKQGYKVNENQTKVNERRRQEGQFEINNSLGSAIKKSLTNSMVHSPMFEKPSQTIQNSFIWGSQNAPKSKSQIDQKLTKCINSNLIHTQLAQYPNSWQN